MGLICNERSRLENGQPAKQTQRRTLRLLLERFGDQIAGILSCYDRLLIQGTLPKLCFAGGMESYLRQRGVAVRDYPRWAQSLRDQLRENAERLAAENGLQIEFLRRRVRKQDKVQALREKRGEQPGLVCILSAMEKCDSYEPRFDGGAGRWVLKPDRGKCLHYYFYFIDEQLGLGHLRLPTWCPFRLQVCTNGHSWLARKLAEENIGYHLLDNAFTAIGDFEQAQALADGFRVKHLHQRLDELAQRFCPILSQLQVHYHWSADHAE